MKSAEVRQQFLDFFASKMHKVVPSAPMVVKNDPTLMFTNAGSLRTCGCYCAGICAPPTPPLSLQSRLNRPVTPKVAYLEQVRVYKGTAETCTPP